MPMPDETGVPARLDSRREERLRFLLLECAIASPSAKTFDVDEMRYLVEDMRAVLGEIDYLRSHVPSPASGAPSEPTREALNRMEERLVRALSGHWCVEVEEGAACCAWYDGVLVANGQGTVVECFDAALEAVWGDGGVMRPEFAARLDAARERKRAAVPERS